MPGVVDSVGKGFGENLAIIVGIGALVGIVYWYLKNNQSAISAGASNAILSNPITKIGTNASANYTATVESGNLSYIDAPDSYVQAYGGGVGGTQVTASTQSEIAENINTSNPSLSQALVYLATNNAGQVVSDVFV